MVSILYTRQSDKHEQQQQTQASNHSLNQEQANHRRITVDGAAVFDAGAAVVNPKKKTTGA